MKKIILIGLFIVLVVVSGCTTSFSDCMLYCGRRIKDCKVNNAIDLKITCSTIKESKEVTDYCFDKCS